MRSLYIEEVPVHLGTFGLLKNIDDMIGGLGLSDKNWPGNSDPKSKRSLKVLLQFLKLTIFEIELGVSNICKTASYYWYLFIPCQIFSLVSLYAL